MVVQLGQMQLPAPQDPDPSDDYFNGTIAGGGLWTALTRASDHDHTGGVSGKPISIASIPDGSITTAKLDPSVLLPYALTDGSKPFTGTVSMNADAIVRDALFFGQQGSAGAADVSLTRTAAGTLLFAGGGSKAWLELRSPASTGAVRIGQPVAPAASVWLTANMDFNGAAWVRDDTTKPALQMTIGTADPANGATAFSLLAVKPGANPVAGFLTRLRMDNLGTFTLTPDAGAFGLSIDKPDAASYLMYLGLARQNAGKWNLGLGPSDEFMLYNGDGSKIRSYVTALGTTNLQPDAGQPALNAMNGRVASIGTGDTGFSFSSRDTGGAGFLLFGQAGSAYLYDQAQAKQRIQVNAAGAVIVNPDAGSPGLLLINPSAGLALEPNSTNYRLRSSAGNLELQASGAIIHPNADNSHHLGYTSVRWIAVYAVNGTIQTSSREAKTDIVPLDPGAAMAAVRNTEAVTFDYLPPVRDPAQYELPDDPETAEVVLRQRLEMAPVEQAIRHQAGFVAEQADPLFLVGEKDTSPNNSIGVLLAALQNLDTRLSALEGA